MMKLLKGLAVALLLAPGTLAAQTFPKPPDVPDYVEVVPVWDSGTAPNEPLDPGVTPYTSISLPDIPTPTTGRIVPGSEQALTNIDGGPAFEAKFRTVINASKVLYDDPIRDWGEPGGAHCHVFFGNVEVNAFSTFASLRTDGISYAAGEKLNNTAYWFPCWVKGNKVIKPLRVITYYAEHPEDGIKSTIPPNGLRYIGGVDMDDRFRSKQLARIAAANAAVGSERYKDRSGTEEKRYFNYVCFGATPVLSPNLKNLDGSDPWGGTCTAEKPLYVQFEGPSCWDGKNLWSPGGYDHVIYPIWDTLHGGWQCPINYYRISPVLLQISYRQNGFADYGQWRLDSDDMLAASSGQPVANGESFHTDWFGAWDRATFVKFQRYCIGARDNNEVGYNPPHECNSSAITGTETLIVEEPGPSGRDPQVRLHDVFDNDDPEGYWLVPAQQNGPTTIHLHGE